MKLKNKVILTLFVVTGFFQKITAQTEFETWGNLIGIRTDQGLHGFNTSLLLVNEQKYQWPTRKEGQKTDFKRDDETKIFSYEMRNIRWTQTIKSLTTHSVRVQIDFSSPKDTLIQGAYFRINLPQEFNNETRFEITNPESLSALDISSDFDNTSYKAPVQAVSMLTKKRGIHVKAKDQTELMITMGKDSINPEFGLNFAIATGSLAEGKTYSNTFDIEVSGEPENAPVALKLFPEQEGNLFEGIGGNFRLQNPKNDPQVIDYSLDNLNVTWGRVELPWKLWHPDLDKNPKLEAKNGNLHPKVEASLEMARRLDKRGIPVILAAWFAPNWAIIGERAEGVNLDGSRGNQLDQSKKEEIYRSITSYVEFLKEEYGVEAFLFSFNESDLGIDVRQTPEEHDQLIRELGSLFKNAGLNTKLLLGDTADANGWDFTTTASLNPESVPYIGGVSFHSWRGWSQKNLLEWYDIANRVGQPLFVGEGSIDAGAWRYPQIFEEPSYALEEIRIYLKILKFAQPLSILQWQLTSDYSVLSGGGIYGNDDKLKPTQRFFNLKQLGKTPSGLRNIPVTSNQESVTAAALGSKERGQYALHLVNKGGKRSIEVTGIPSSISAFNVYVTDQNNSFKRIKKVQVSNGKINLFAEGGSFISLFSVNLK